MSFDYSSQTVYLRDLGPGFDRFCEYPLCEMHAGRFSAPLGWAVDDGRTVVEPPMFLSTDVA